MAQEELAILVRMRDFATTNFVRLRQTITGVGKSLFTLKGMFLSVGAAYTGMKLVDLAAKLEGVEHGFENLAKEIGGAEAVLDAMRKGARGTVSDLELMTIGNTMLTFKLAKTAEEVQGLTEGARRMARVMGTDLKTAMDGLITGLARGSAQRLDNVGIVISEIEVNQRYAASIGKTVGELTEAQKKTAVQAEALKQLVELTKRAGSDTFLLADAWGQFKSELANFGLNVLREVTPALKELFLILTDYIKNNQPVLLRGIADITEGVGSLMPLLGELAITLERIMQTISKPGNLGESAWFGVVESAAQLAEKLTGGMLESTGKFQKKAEDALGLNDPEILKRMEVMRAGFLAISDAAAKGAAAMRARADAMEGAKVVEEEIVDVIERECESLPTHTKLVVEDAEAIKKRAEAMAKLAEEAQKFREVYTLVGGLEAAFEKMADEGAQWGASVVRAVDEIANSIAGNATDAILAWAQGVMTAGNAFRKFASEVLMEISRIILQMTILNAVKAGIGGLGGMLFPMGAPGGAAAGGVFGGHFAPVPVAGHLSYGDVVTRRGLYELREAGRNEAVVPLPDNRSIPVKFTGRGADGGGVQNIVNVTVNGASPGMERQALLRQADTIAAVVLSKMRESQRFREGMVA